MKTVLTFENPPTNDFLRGYKSIRQGSNNKNFDLYRIEYKEKNTWYNWQEFTQKELFLKEWNKLTSQEIKDI